MAEGGQEATITADPAVAQTALLAEIRAGFKSLDGRFDTLDKRLDAMGAKLETHERRLDTVEGRTSDLEDGATQSLKRLERVEKILKDVAIKNKDLEARSRRDNLRILGIPESTNKGRMDIFVETMLIDIFGKEAFTVGFVVERAHRSLGPRPNPGCPPRPIIGRIMNYRDRDTALCLSRECGTLSWQGSMVAIYPDFNHDGSRSEAQIFRSQGYFT